MFCVITVTFELGQRCASCAIAMCPALGSYCRSAFEPGSATTCAGIQNLSYQPLGSLRNACLVPHSSTQLAQTPPSPRNVGMPLGAESPEPVTKTTASPLRMIWASLSSDDSIERVSEAESWDEAAVAASFEESGRTGGSATATSTDRAHSAIAGRVLGEGRGNEKAETILDRRQQHQQQAGW